MVTLGGPGTLAGPAIGAGAIVLLKNVISGLHAAMAADSRRRVHSYHSLGAAGTVEFGRDAAGQSHEPEHETIAAIFALAHGRLPRRCLLAGQTAPQSPAPDPSACGFVAPLSGAYAQNGRDILNGLRLYLEQIGSQAAGRKIELIVEDDEAIPANSLTKAREARRAR